MLPVTHRRQMRTSDMAERINQKIKRRANVIKIFQNVESCERLVTAISMGISMQWQSGENYLTIERN